eukprot:5316497-Lingulodinium_polyedra.AAC.1
MGRAPASARPMIENTHAPQPARPEAGPPSPRHRAGQRLPSKAARRATGTLPPHRAHEHAPSRTLT